MEKISIGKDDNGRDIFKLKNIDKSFLKFFNTSDIMIGNPMSNIAIAFIYTWKSDEPPENIKNIFLKISNYAFITGYWRTTNGAKYVFSNLLINPNINKLIVCVFDNNDNGHMLVDALRCFWKNGVSKDGIIKESIASNPSFEGLSIEALERLRKQVDLIIIKKTTNDKLEETVKACIQEPKNKKTIKDIEIISVFNNDDNCAKTLVDDDVNNENNNDINNDIKSIKLYDSGARFDEPYIAEIKSISMDDIEGMPETQVISTLGLSITADNIDDALKKIISEVSKKGSVLKDQRKITIREERSLSVVIKDPVAKLPDFYSKDYLEKYKNEFLDGNSDKNEFVYTYHDRIFNKWGNQPERIIELLKKSPNTRRAMISLWDPEKDLGSQTPPCLNFIWFCVRSNKLECHIVYRSHHIATVDKKGNIVPGEGAFVPNLYAIYHLHEMIAEKTEFDIGPMILTDFSGHLYVCD
jgi:thymidylate synthase (methanogen type)